MENGVSPRRMPLADTVLESGKSYQAFNAASMLFLAHQGLDCLHDLRGEGKELFDLRQARAKRVSEKEEIFVSLETVAELAAGSSHAIHPHMTTGARRRFAIGSSPACGRYP